jgi:hypothetical protein
MKTFIKGIQLTNDSRKLAEKTDYGTGIQFLVGAIQCSPAEAFDVLTKAARIIGNTEHGNIRVKTYKRNTKKIKNPRLTRVIKGIYEKFSDYLNE